MARDKPKAQFAAMPLRAIGDGRLTDRDFRILAAVASHDRMSSVRGTGQGAWASHKTMAAEVGGDGADYARFSVSMNKLVALGYLQRDRLEGDARKHTYRIIYTAADCLPQCKPSEAGKVCSSAKHLAADSLPDIDESGEIVCRAPQLSVENESETDAQYISRSEEGDSAEAGKEDSAEAARCEARDGLLEVDLSQTAEANLARLERALKRGSPVHRVSWYGYLLALQDHRPDLSNQAFRVSEDLAETMTAGEIEASRR